MKKHRKYKILSAFVITLALLTLFSCIMVSGYIVRVTDDTPYIKVAQSGVEASPAATLTVVSAEELYEEFSVTAEDVSMSYPQYENAPPMYEADFGDATGLWSQSATLEIFKAEYKNGEGKVTVSSESGKVVAPGTENDYYFYVVNNGAMPLYYWVEAYASATVSIDGKTLQVPLQAKFFKEAGRYILGTENSFEALQSLNGKKDEGGLSPNHQTRYFLQWQWPFEGDDGLDTLLGNLSAEGENISVSVGFKVLAAEDPDAGGGDPVMGDSNNMALWVGVCVLSAVTMLMLLFARKRIEYEEEA